jgi:hypothetical protein
MAKRMSEILIVALFCVAACFGQSVADAARQERQKDAAKDSATTPKIITNDELTSALPQQSTPAARKSNSKESNPERDKAAFAKNAERTKAAILAQKTKITAMQAEIEKARASIHYVEVGVPANPNQLQKQKAADRMQEQLNEETQKLTEMQEAARRAGFGSVVYKP